MLVLSIHHFLLRVFNNTYVEWIHIYKVYIIYLYSLCFLLYSIHFNHRFNKCTLCGICFISFVHCEVAIQLSIKQSNNQSITYLRSLNNHTCTHATTISTLPIYNTVQHNIKKEIYKRKVKISYHEIITLPISQSYLSSLTLTDDKNIEYVT